MYLYEKSTLHGTHQNVSCSHDALYRLYKQNVYPRFTQTNVFELTLNSLPYLYLNWKRLNIKLIHAQLSIWSHIYTRSHLFGVFTLSSCWLWDCGLLYPGRPYIILSKSSNLQVDKTHSLCPQYHSLLNPHLPLDLRIAHSLLNSIESQAYPLKIRLWTIKMDYLLKLTIMFGNQVKSNFFQYNNVQAKIFQAQC